MEKAFVNLYKNFKEESSERKKINYNHYIVLNFLENYIFEKHLNIEWGVYDKDIEGNGNKNNEIWEPISLIWR
jgi:hypothetical protein